MRNLFTLAVSIATICTTSITSGAQQPSELFQDEMHVEGRKLSLNGVGVREETIFNIDAFAAALYLESPSTNPNQILGSNEIKTLKVRFLRNFSQAEIQDRWQQLFKGSCVSNCDSFERSLRSFNSQMPSVKKNQEMSFYFLPNRIEVFFEYHKITDIADRAFADTLLRSWIAPHNSDSTLYQALLKGGPNDRPAQLPN